MRCTFLYLCTIKCIESKVSDFTQWDQVTVITYIDVGWTLSIHIFFLSMPLHLYQISKTYIYQVPFKRKKDICTYIVGDLSILRIVRQYKFKWHAATKSKFTATGNVFNNMGMKFVKIRQYV